MSNDKVQSIMELVDTITDCAQKGYPFSNMRIVLESAIREAIAAPGVAQEFHEAFKRMNRDERHNNMAEVAYWLQQYKLFARRLLSAAPSPTAEQRPPYCGSGHCSCIECPYGSIKGGTEE